MNLKKLQQHFYQALLAQDSALPEWIADNKARRLYEQIGAPRQAAL